MTQHHEQQRYNTHGNSSSRFDVMVVFVFSPSLCELALPFHSMSYYSWRAIAGGWGMSNSKNDDRTSLRLLKATASTVWAIQETRSWETRVYLQSSNKQPLPVAVVLLAITPIPSRYVDWVTLSLLIMNIHREKLSTLDGVNDSQLFTLAGCVNKPVFVYLKKKVKARLSYF